MADQGLVASWTWGEIRETLSSNKKDKLKGLNVCQEYVQHHQLDRNMVGELLDLSAALLADANPKVSQQMLDILDLLVRNERDLVKPYANTLIPSVVERLGDSRQPIRQQALHVLVSMFSSLRADFVWDKLSQHWPHKNWKVRHGLLEVLAEANIKLGTGALLTKDQGASPMVKQVIKLLDDNEGMVREAAADCLCELAKTVGASVLDIVRTSNLRPAQQQALISRLSSSSASSSLPAGMPAAGYHTSIGGYHMDDNTLDTVSVMDVEVVSDNGETATLRANSYMRPTTGPLKQQLQARPSGASSLGMLTTTGKAVSTGHAAMPPPAATTATTANAYVAPSAGPATAAKRKEAQAPAAGEGDLQAATPLPIYSEKELRMDLEKAVEELAKAPTADWLARMACMVKVEGLVLGGAMDYDAFHDALKSISMALCQQFKERRSMIARQACHLISVLAQAMGARFEPHALILLPTLLTVVVITVQVIADSADSGIRAIISYCQTPRVMALIAEAVQKEKNPKTRSFCTGYLQQALKSWDSSTWLRCGDVVDAAVLRAAQDTMAETRATARAAMAAYTASAPERAYAFMRRLDPSMQEKLQGGAGSRGARPQANPVSRRELKAAFVGQLQPGEDEPVVVLVAGSRPEPPHRPRPSRAPVRASAAAELPAADHQALHARSSHAHEQRAASIVATFPVSAGGSSGGSSTASGMQLAGLIAASEGRMSPPGGSSSMCGGAAPAGQPPRPKVSAARKSLAMPPGRVLGTGSTDLTTLLTEASDRLSTLYVGASANATADAALARKQAARRVSSAAGGSGPAAQRLASSSVSVASVASASSFGSQAVAAYAGGPGQSSPDSRMAPSTTGKASAAQPSSLYPQQQALVPAAVSRSVMQQLFSTLQAGPRTWGDKVDAFTALIDAFMSMAPASTRDALQLVQLPPGAAQASVQELATATVLLERARDKVLEALEDPHHKVLGAAMDFVRVSVAVVPRAYEPCLDRLLPLLFLRLADGKEMMRAACAEALKGCAGAYRPEQLLPLLTKSLDAVKVLRGRLMVLEFFRDIVAPYAVPRDQAQQAHLRQWLLRVSPLLEDRSVELRHMAQDVVEVLWASPACREALSNVAYNSNHQDIVPLRKLVLALNGAAGPAAGGDLAVAGMSASIGMQEAGSNNLRASGGLQSGMLGMPATQPTGHDSSVGGSQDSSFINGMAANRAQPPATPAGNAYAHSQGDVVMGDAYGFEPSPARPSTASRASPRQPYNPASYASPARPGMGSGIGAMNEAMDPAALACKTWGSEDGGPSGNNAGTAFGAATALLPTSRANPVLHTGQGYGGLVHSEWVDSNAAAFRESAGAGVEQWVSSGGAEAPVSRAPINVPSDKNAQVMHIDRIMAGLRRQGASAADAPSKLDLYTKLAEAAQQCSLAAWKQAFPRLSVEAKAWLSEPCEPLRGSGSGMAPLPASVISPAEEREAALLALCQLIRHQPALFSEVNLPAWLDVFLNAFAADEYPNVKKAASCGLMTCVAAVQADSALTILRMLLPRERRMHLAQPHASGQRLVALLEAIKSCFGRLTRPALELAVFNQATPDAAAAALGVAAAPPLLEALQACMPDASSGVRRLAVLCLAELWYLLGIRVRDTLFADPVPLPAHATPHESVNGKLTAQTLLATYYLKRLGLTMETGVSPLTHPFVMDPVPLPSLPLQR